MKFMEFNEFEILDVGNEVTMVGSMFGGKGKLFLCLFPESNYAADDVEVHVLKMSVDEWKALIKQTDTIETEALARAEDGKVYKAIVRKSQRTVDSKVTWNCFRRDEYRCRYCGRDDAPLTIDHLVLWEEGGPTTEENLLSACRKCNKVRGNTPYAEWLKHRHYRRVSRGLTKEVRDANEAIVATLDAIPRVIKVRKR